MKKRSIRAGSSVVLCLMAIGLVSCVAVPYSKRNPLRDICSEIGVCEADVDCYSRCFFARMPIGRSVAAFYEGLFALTNKGIHILSYADTTGRYHGSIDLSVSDLKSAALYSFLRSRQLQFFTDKSLLAVEIIEDNGQFHDREACENIFSALVNRGVREVEAFKAVQRRTSPSSIVIINAGRRIY